MNFGDFTLHPLQLSEFETIPSVIIEAESAKERLDKVIEPIILD